MQQTLVIPYLRSSPLHDSRRDLVAHAAESFALRVTVIEKDEPNAPLLVVTGGMGGPAAQLVIWADYHPDCRGCDYGRPPMRGGTLWAGWGVPQPGLGSFDFFLPAGVFYSQPLRCGWGVQLVWDAGTKVDMLSQGMLHIGGSFGPGAPPDSGEPIVTDDTLDPITTD